MPPIFLSLIIPVYKAQDFIEACLNSVFSQTPDDVEVILVDDGTPDSSIAIVKRVFDQQIKDGKLVLLEQSNKGPGAARNTGTQRARGDFIAFLDSDDVLMDGYFKAVMPLLKGGIVDIVEFGFKRFSNQESLYDESYSSMYGFEGLQKLSDVREQVFSVGCWYPSTRIYRRRLIESHRFPEGTHYEDLMTIPFIYLHDLIVYFIGKPLLGYRYNPGSITSTHTIKQLGEKYAFYKSIRSSTDCESMKILALKTARGMVYFNSELNFQEFSLGELIREIRVMHLKPKTRKQLRLADRMFLSFPAVYIWLDKIRVPIKKLLIKFSLAK